MEMKKYKLSEIATVEISGVDKKTKENERTIKLCNFTDVYHNWAIIKDMEVSFMEATATDKEIDTFVLKKGQVAFTKDSETRDDIGIPTYIADNFENVILGYHTALITPDKTKLSGKYLNAFMNSKFIKKYFENNASGSGQRYTLSNGALDSIPVILPELSIQEKIGEIFSNIDRKIALNKKINAKLEAMAKRLYDYWFVQFDFPNENGKPYKSSGGKMVWNEVLKCEIPEGWEVKSINEVCDVIDCLHSKKPDFCYEDEDSYLLSLENITKEGYIDISEKYYISKKDFSEWTSRICVKENDFLFTNAGRAGDMGMIPNGIKCAIGRNITAVRSKKINPYYLRCFFKSLYMKEQILNNLDKGCFFMSFNVRSIKQLSILIPKEENFHKFISFCEPIIKQLNKNNSEIQKLTNLRDRLLPLLMNGQVEVEG